MWFHKAETVATLVLELVIPPLYFAPRRLRVFAFWLTVLLQVTIAATGNFGFFNLLTVAIAVVLLDDASFPRWVRDRRWPEPPERRRRPAWRGIALAPLAIVLLVATTARGVLRAHFRPDWAAAAYSLTRPVEPYHVANAYGLFEVMTTERPEIIVQGSDDGVTWKSYTFRYKPDDELARRPRFCTPHMPRLDWQLWFAAMGDVNSSPWTIGLFRRLELRAILSSGISAVAEEPDAVVWRHGRQRDADRVVQGLDAAGRQRPQLALHLAPQVLDRVEVGRVRRQVAQLGAGGLDRLAHSGRLVRAEVVHHDHVAGRNCGARTSRT
jgi:hypothetical protein